MSGGRRLRTLAEGRGVAFLVMLGSFALAVPMMLLFEHPITRAMGVVALFTFIAAGVFAIAEDAFLEEEDEVSIEDRPRGSSPGTPAA